MTNVSSEVCLKPVIALHPLLVLLAHLFTKGVLQSAVLEIFQCQKEPWDNLRRSDNPSTQVRFLTASLLSHSKRIEGKTSTAPASVSLEAVN